MISEGETPLILPAWAIVTGLTFVIFCLASVDKDAILELLKLKPKYEYIEGFISCDLENIDLNGKEEQLDILLESMYEMLKSISDEYSKNVKLIEKEAS